MKNKKTNSKALWFFILHVLLLFYASCGVFSKLAAQQTFLSGKFILFYACEIAVLFTYTLVWQQVLKHLPLTVAFCNKSVSMIWTMLCGVLFFQEVITVNMLIGAGIVLVGVIVVVTEHE